MKKILQISDCHFNSENNQNKDNLIHALRFINKIDFDYIFITGDICENPSIIQYEIFNKLIDKQIKSKEIYAIAGNHDDIDLMKIAFTDTSIKIIDHLIVEEFKFLFIDSSKKPKEIMPLGSGRVSKSDIKRISESKEETVLVIHHPILKNGCEWFESIGIENQEDVAKAALKNKKVKNIICGHGHSYIKTELQQITQIMSPSTSYGFDHDSKIFKKNNNLGAILIEVDKDIKYKEIKIPLNTESQ